MLVCHGMYASVYVGPSTVYSVAVFLNRFYSLERSGKPGKEPKQH